MKRTAHQARVSTKAEKSSKRVNREVGGGVVTVDPFLVKKGGNSKQCRDSKNSNYETAKVKVEDRNFPCRWQVGLRGACQRILDSPDELIEHLLSDHANFGTRGYICNWTGCAKMSVVHFTSKMEFKDHLKFHAVISPFPEEGEGDGSDESFDAADVSSSDDDSEYSAGDSDEDYGKKKRKTKKKSKAVLVKSKTTASNTVAKSTVPVAKSTVPVAKIAPSQEYSSVALSFYRFTCMWEVSFILKTTRSDGKPQTVSCHRKFTVLQESIDHLHDHHLKKMASQNDPLMCCWKDCSLKNNVFDSMDELKQHVVLHTEEKMITYANNLKENTSKRDPLVRVVSVEQKNIPPTPSTPANTASTPSPSLPKAVAPVKPTPNVSLPEDKLELPLVCEEQNCWMVASLRFLLMAKLPDFPETLCPPSRLCAFCRFYSLKNRLATKGTPLPYAMYEFTMMKEKYESCGEDPMKFLERFLSDAASHEAFHGKSTFRESFWTKKIIDGDRMCTQHPLNRNLLNLFSSQYQNCSTCVIESESWPSASHQNVIIDMGTDERIYYPETLVIKGRVYQLWSVVCQDLFNNLEPFYTHTRLVNKWVTYKGNFSFMATSSQVFKAKNARIVLYVAKVTNQAAEFAGTVVESYTFDECRTLPSDNLADHEDGDRKESISDMMKVGPRDEEDFLSLPVLKSLFASRRLLNDGNSSCLNSVIQALLASSLVKVVKDLCFSRGRCYFCRMLSLTQRVVHNGASSVTDPYELSHHREELGMSDKEGHPGTGIRNLILGIIADEEKQHGTSDVKYKFMIRFQKKSCGCLQSLEEYHWTVSPTKKNESLFDLMTRRSVKCTECNVITAVQPIHMPENLIITIERNSNQDDASVHFPDEWAVHNTRYFLVSIIVDNSCDSGSPHYLAYCKVFGRWICYNDCENSKASSCDIFGNKQARVLVYVEEELAPKMIETAFNLAASFAKEKSVKGVSEIRVKEEPIDN